MMLELNFYPLDIFCIALIALLALVLPSQAISDRFAGVLKSSRDWLPLITGLFLVNYAAVVIYYINSPAIVDHGEIMVPAASWMFQSGHPLYTNMDDAARYSTIYGPVGHVFYAWAMGLLGPTIFACKIASGLAGLGSCLLAYLTFSKSFSRWIAWMATGLTAIYFLVFPIHTYLLKHDPFVIFFTALALWACTSLKARPAQILLAIATGMLVNLKPHSFLYTMPLLALHYQRAGLKSVIGASVGAVGVAVLPYLSKNISFWNWVAIMHSEAGAGFVGLNVLANTQWFAFLGVAFVALCYLLARNKPAALSVLLSANKWYLLSLGFSLFCVAVISSRNGSGPGHFVPLFQLVLYACCLIVEQLNTVAEEYVIDKEVSGVVSCCSAYCSCFDSFNEVIDRY